MLRFYDLYTNNKEECNTYNKKNMMSPNIKNNNQEIRNLNMHNNTVQNRTQEINEEIANHYDKYINNFNSIQCTNDISTIRNSEIINRNNDYDSSGRFSNTSNNKHNNHVSQSSLNNCNQVNTFNSNNVNQDRYNSQRNIIQYNNHQNNSQQVNNKDCEINDNSKYDRYINNYRGINTCNESVIKEDKNICQNTNNNQNAPYCKEDYYYNLKDNMNSNKLYDINEIEPQIKSGNTLNKQSFNTNKNVVYDNINPCNIVSKAKKFTREYIDLSKNGVTKTNVNDIEDRRNGKWSNRGRYIELDCDEDHPKMVNISCENEPIKVINNECKNKNSNVNKNTNVNKSRLNYDNCNNSNTYEMTCGYIYGRSPNANKDGYPKDVRNLCMDENKVITLEDGTEVYYKEYDKCSNQSNFVNVNELGEVIKSNCIDVKVNKDDTVIRSDLIVEKTTILRVWGRVKDSYDNPIQGAIVSLLRPGDLGEGIEYQCCATTLTDYMGFYEFEVENDYKDVIYRVVVSNGCNK